MDDKLSLYGLVLYDVINYNDAISAADLYESVKMCVSMMYKSWKILSNKSRPETFGTAFDPS